MGRLSRSGLTTRAPSVLVDAGTRLGWPGTGNLRDILREPEVLRRSSKISSNRSPILRASRSSASEQEEERQAHLWFLESMDQVNRAIQGTNDLEQMMSDVLDAVLSIFNCDRAWLVYPCDPEAVIVEGADGACSAGIPRRSSSWDLICPWTRTSRKVFQTVRASSGPVRFGPGSEHPLPAEAAKRFSIQSMIGMAIYPKGDKPYMLGLHQCSYPRVWTPQEERLFQEIGRRLEDALTSLLMFRNLGESERKLEEAQRLAHVGYWERDPDTDLITWSDETYRIFGLRPQARILNLAQLPELIHPEDKQIVVRSRGGGASGWPALRCGVSSGPAQRRGATRPQSGRCHEGRVGPAPPHVRHGARHHRAQAGRATPRGATHSHTDTGGGSYSRRSHAKNTSGRVRVPGMGRRARCGA